MKRILILSLNFTLATFVAAVSALPAAAQSSAVLVAGEPYMLANTDTFSIQGSNGEEIRNRAAVPVAGILQNLFLAPNLQPTAGSVIEACLRVNGVDTSVCVTYTSTDWPGSKGNTTDSVAVSAGDTMSVHFTETAGISSGANVRASFELAPPTPIFVDGFESGSTSAWSSSVGGSSFDAGVTARMKTRAPETQLVGAAPPSSSVIVTGEPYMLAGADGFTIGGSNGTEIRNRAAVPADGSIRNLYLLPNLQPAAGSSILACVRVNGVDSSLCVTYTESDWPGAKGNQTDSVAVSQADLVTVHFTESNGVSSGANVRASFEYLSSTSASAIVTDEPFIQSSADTFSIGGSSGSEERNRAAAPYSGTISSLYLAPNLDPIAGSSIQGCVRVNGVDSGLCVTYSTADWPGAKGATGSVNVNEGDLITVHFTETAGISSGSNVRATLAFD
jgi:hypothetical protein